MQRTIKLCRNIITENTGDGRWLMNEGPLVPFHAPCELRIYEEDGRKACYPLEGIIFDLDGCLADSMWMWKTIDVEYLARYGIEVPDDLQKLIGGCSIRETADLFRERFGIRETPEKMLDDWNRMAWDAYAERVTLKPGAKELLDWCRETGLKTGIASSNSRELVEVFLRNQKIRDRFGAVVTGSEVHNGKPAPDVFLTAAKICGAEPSLCLAFDDLPDGLMAARSAGMVVCGVHDDHSLYPDEEKIPLTDLYIRDFTQFFYETAGET